MIQKHKINKKKIPSKEKTLATIQVDVDSFWAIAENAEIAISKEIASSIYESAVPRFLELFKEFDIRATFFVIGKDLLNRKNRLIVKELTRQGHEVANHTTNHISNRPFSSLSLEEKIQEIKLCHNIIAETTGIEPVGFKVPAYSFVSENDLQILNEAGYTYDSSAMLVSIAGLLKKFQFIFQSITGKSYWHSSQTKSKSSNVIQIPVSTTPFLISLFILLLFLH